MSVRRPKFSAALAAVSAVGGVLLSGCDSGNKGTVSVSGDLLTTVNDLAKEEAERQASEPSVSISVQRLSPAPVLDGSLDDECWSGAATTDSFVLVQAGDDTSGRAATQATVCALGFDDTALYVAFRCNEDQPDGIQSGQASRDAEVWTDDCVEIYLDLSQQRSRFLRFAVNPQGVKYDARCQPGAACDAEWNAEWQAATAVESSGWIAEIAIPFRALGLPGLLPGMRVGANLVRRETPHQELSAWSPVREQPEDPSSFGEIVLGDGPYRVALVTAGDLAWGRNVGELSLTQLTKQSGPVDIKAEFAGGSEVGVGDTVTVMVPEGKTRTVRFHYEVTQRDIADELVVSVTDRASGQQFYYVTFPFQVSDLLDLALDKPEYPASAATATAKVQVKAGKDSLGDLRVKLKVTGKDKPDTELTKGTIKAPPQSSEVVLDLSNLGEGEYVLSGALSNADGDALGRVDRAFRKGPDTPEEAGKEAQQSVPEEGG